MKFIIKYKQKDLIKNLKIPDTKLIKKMSSKKFEKPIIDIFQVCHKQEAFVNKCFWHVL